MTPRKLIDKQAIQDAAYALAESEGLAALSIRSVASACGVSVGSIYNYYPTKDALLVDVIARFWGTAFRNDLCRPVPGENFVDYVARAFEAMHQALADFRADWLPQISALSLGGIDAGKKREAMAFDHIGHGLLQVLQADKHAAPEKLGGVSNQELCAFVVRAMIASLRDGRQDCAVLLALLRSALYV
ncbi:MAG: TetR/AcrR family transcriptional regulator [Raoultibacter sp.]